MVAKYSKKKNLRKTKPKAKVKSKLRGGKGWLKAYRARSAAKSSPLIKIPKKCEENANLLKMEFNNLLKKDYFEALPLAIKNSVKTVFDLNYNPDDPNDKTLQLTMEIVKIMAGYKNNVYNNLYRGIEIDRVTYQCSDGSTGSLNPLIRLDSELRQILIKKLNEADYYQLQQQFVQPGPGYPTQPGQGYLPQQPPQQGRL